MDSVNNLRQYLLGAVFAALIPGCSYNDEISPAWSPDGSSIAFASNREASTGGPEKDLYVMGADGGNPRRITDTPHDDDDPVWSPDGKRIAYQRRTTNRELEIHVVNADGSGEVNLSQSPEDKEAVQNRVAWLKEHERRMRAEAEALGVSARTLDGWIQYERLRRDFGPTWSADSSRIAFGSKRGEYAQVYVVNADGTGLMQLTHHELSASYPAWSPEGNLIAYLVDGEVSVIDVNDRKARGLVVQALSLSKPTWSPDGKQLLVRAAEDPGGLWVIQADGSDSWRLTGPVALDPSWSPDGSSVAFWRFQEIFVMSVSGGRPRLIAWKAESPLSWSPDGSRLTFGGYAHGDYDIYVADADGSQLRNLSRGRDEPPAAEVGIERLREALRREPGDVEGWKLLAEFYEDLGREVDALAALEKGLEADPRDPGALNNLGWLCATAQDPSVRNSGKALAYAENAVEASHTRDPAILDTLAEAHYVNENFDQAISTAQEAIELAPEGDAIRRHLRHQVKKFQEAKRAKRGD